MNDSIPTDKWAKISKWKVILIVFMLFIVIFLLFFVNTFWGNPIRKQIAKTRCLNYFQNQYEEEFYIEEIQFAFKFPGYILTLSPKYDPQIKFSCNPNCNTLCYTDEYGGKLASRILVKQIGEILEPRYAQLGLMISASEDPYTYYGGETPDYFESDPIRRLMKNHQDLTITWIDPTLQADEFNRLTEEMASLIEMHLPWINPNLQVYFAVYPDQAMQTARYEAHLFLFPTMNFED